MTTRLLCFSFFVFVLSNCVSAKTTAYSGGVKTFASSTKYLALHEHGVSYDKVEGSQEYSRLSLLEITGDSYNFVKRVDSPEFVALAWSPDSKYLAAVSNLYGPESNHIYIFDSKINQIMALSWGCKEQIYNPLFCGSSFSVEQQWLNKILDRVSINLTLEGIELCTDRFCRDIKIPDHK